MFETDPLIGASHRIECILELFIIFITLHDALGSRGPEGGSRAGRLYVTIKQGFGRSSRYDAFRDSIGILLMRIPFLPYTPIQADTAPLLYQVRRFVRSGE